MVIKIKNTMIKKKMTIKKKCNYNKTNKTYKKKTKCRINKQKRGGGWSDIKKSSLQTALLKKIYNILKHTRQITGLYHVLCLLLTQMESSNPKFDFNKIPKENRGQLKTSQSTSEVDLTFSISMLERINKNTLLFNFSSIYWKLLCLDFMYEEKNSQSVESSNDTVTDIMPRLINTLQDKIMRRYINSAGRDSDVLSLFKGKYGVTFNNQDTDSDFYFTNNTSTNTTIPRCELMESIHRELKRSSIKRTHFSVFDFDYSSNNIPRTQNQMYATDPKKAALQNMFYTNGRPENNNAYYLGQNSRESAGRTVYAVPYNSQSKYYNGLHNMSSASNYTSMNLPAFRANESEYEEMPQSEEQKAKLQQFLNSRNPHQ